MKVSFTADLEPGECVTVAISAGPDWEDEEEYDPDPERVPEESDEEPVEFEYPQPLAAVGK